MCVSIILPTRIGGSIFARPARASGRSVTELEEAVRVNPENAESRQRLSAALHRSEQLQRAIEQQREAVSAVSHP